MEKSNDITKKREANIELLRIVAMLMVISLHCVGNGRLLSNSQVSLPNLIGIRLIDSLSLVAVSAFFIVSGYYMINKSMNLKKIFCLWGKVIFYSLLLYLICSLINHKTEIYPTFFPVLSGQYWFIDAYIVLYLFSPILNIMLNKLNKSQFKYLLIFWLIILGIIRIIFNPAELFSGKILAVFMIYSIGAYIRKFVDIKPKQKYSIKYIMLTIIFTLLYIILITIHGVITNETLYNLFYKIIVNFREFYNLIVVAMTIIIFMKFKTMKIKSKLLSKVILFISPSVFSIYLIHYNYNIRDDIWLNSGAMNFANSWLMIPYIILTIIAVFIICLTIDLIRRGIYALLKKIPLLNKGIDKLNSFINRLNLKINNSISIETNQT